MTETGNSADRLRATLVLLATLGTIVFNLLAAVGRVNGVTPDAISARYPTILTPAGYAFTIWSLIYVGMIAFSVYQALPSNRLAFRSIRTIYILTCLLNCAWIYFWHQDAIGVCLAVIVALAATLIFMLAKFGRNVSARDALFTTLPFGIYAGWVTAAALVNFVVFLVYIDAKLSAQMWNVVGIAGLGVGVAAAVVVRVKIRNFLYPLSLAWAATAIALNHPGNTAIIVAAALAVIVCLVLSISFVMDQKGSAAPMNNE